VRKMLKKSLGLSLVLAGAAAAGTYPPSSQVSAQASAPKATKEERAVISQTLPKMDGGHLEVKVVEVAYGPGGSSPPFASLSRHRRSCRRHYSGTGYG
jgi:hypothetical protein